jgi:hypothetical protein
MLHMQTLVIDLILILNQKNVTAMQTGAQGNGPARLAWPGLSVAGRVHCQRA